MKRVEWLCVLALMSGLAVGCGDDDTGMTGMDTGPGGDDTGPGEVNCPTSAPDVDSMMGACCYRSENDSANPNFRVSGLMIESPRSLASPIVRSLLASNLDGETFNWLIEITGAAADGEITVRTGYGERNADSTFSFTEGSAPGPGDPNRWDPLSVMANLSGELVTAPPIDGVFSVPVLDEETGEPFLELPLQAFELLGATMSNDRNCVGERTGARYDTSMGMIRTYITIEDAQMAMIGDPLNTDLCTFTAGILSGTCADNDQADWPVQPDAQCTGGTCTDACDGATTCNAWTITGGFSAQSVTIN